MDDVVAPADLVAGVVEDVELVARIPLAPNPVPHMSAAVPADQNGRENKRPRTAFATYQEYAKVVLDIAGMTGVGAVQGTAIVSDILCESDGYSDSIQKVTTAVDTTFSGIVLQDAAGGNVPLERKARTALMLIRWLCEPHTWEKSVLNDCLLSKLLLGEDARAHIDGVYIPVFAVWRRQMKFTLKHVRDMTDIMELWRSYVAALISNRVGEEWTSVTAFFAHGAAGRAILAQGLAFDLDHAVDEAGENSKGWVSRLKTIHRYQKDFLGTQQKLDHIISTMVNYFQEPRQQAPVISCEDACLRLRWGHPYEQISHASSNNCYIRIPAAISANFNPGDELRQDIFIANCFWNKRGLVSEQVHFVDLCYTCLALAGTRRMLPAVAVALLGSGENGKTKWGLSKVRLFGGEAGRCDFVDPIVLFDKNEFRINMGHYLNFLGLVFDEAGDTGNSGGKGKKMLDASLMKLLLDRKTVIGRPPYAREAGEHA